MRMKKFQAIRKQIWNIGEHWFGLPFNNQTAYQDSKVKA